MTEKDRARHVWLYGFCRRLVRLPMHWLLGFTGEECRDFPTPFLLLSNHNTDLDPLLISQSFPAQMYFVASEHVFRKGFVSRVLEWAFAPISRIKGATDASAALDILRHLKSGHNVCLFAEGNRSYNGVTGPVFPATGKLVKSAKATLITYRFIGGYLTSPRWSKSFRKGKMRGAAVGMYAPETLKDMRPDEINALIARDLSEDAFLREEAENLSYRGRNLAESLETALYACPRCGRIGRLHSRGDRFTCECGLSVSYTEKGTFSGGNAPFQNVRDWDVWQSGFMKRFAEALGSGPAFFDEGVTLTAVDALHRMRELSRGRLCLSREALSVGEKTFPMADISGMSLFGKAKIAFTAAGYHFELRFPPAGCGRKYYALYQLLKS